jgi:hypothetical protein
MEETKFHAVVDRNSEYTVTLCTRWIRNHRARGVKLWAAIRKPERITCKHCRRVLNSGKKKFHIRRVGWINLETGGVSR